VAVVVNVVRLAPAVEVPAQQPVPYTFLHWLSIFFWLTVHIEKLESVMSVRGTMSEPRITMGPRETPLSTVPVQLLNVKLLRATAPVLGVLCDSQY
jgi:hypothetical protein